MQDLTRKGFLDAMVMGAAGVGIASGFSVVRAANAEAAPAEVAYDNEWSGPGSADGSWTATPAELAAVGGSNMPLDEINRRRKLYVDAQTAYTCSDGTVIPEVYVKARALLNTYGYGIGNTPNDHSYDMFMRELTPEEAQAYLDMPWGQKFTVADFYRTSDYSIEECEEFCEALFNKRYVNRTSTDNGVTYEHVGFSMRMVNYHLPESLTDPAVTGSMFGPTGVFAEDLDELAYTKSGTPWFTPFPVNASVVKDGAIDPYDDIDALLKSKNKFAVAPCICRGAYYTMAGGEVPGYPEDSSQLSDFTTEISSNKGYAHIETCLSIGEEAQALIDLGAGREITLDEALDIVHRAVDEGLVLERAFSKNAECICCCDRDTCIAINTWKAVAQAQDIAEVRTFKQISHYDLEVDYNACVRCGTCEPRCPMEAITMDGTFNGETGYPQVNASCFRCAQCAYVCPQGARMLVPRPLDEIHEYPRTMGEEANEKAAERFESGLIW